MQISDVGEQRLWLFSPRLDLWLASAGASVGLVVALLVVHFLGDREIDAVDFVLSEFHLGATYHAVIQRRLWRRLPLDVLLVPLAILTITYALSISGHAVLLTSIAMYAAVWHRGRQSVGVARFYQRAMGGPESRAHAVLFRGAIYLPMLAAALAYTHLAPTLYEGEPYFALDSGAQFTSLAGIAAVLWVISYLVYAVRRNRHEIAGKLGETVGGIHSGEWWVVLAHAVAFGSGYVLGASNASFLLVLAVHHEVQYLYFTYAVSRVASSSDQSLTNRNPAMNLPPAHSTKPQRRLQSEWRHAAAFSIWPVLGFAGAAAGGWLNLPWLTPLGAGGLFCHYWLDGRIWTRRSLNA